MKQQGNDEQKGMKKKGFLIQEEMEMLDMKRRCEVIQEKLRMLSCIAVNEGSVREIKSVFLEEGKDGSDGGNNNNNNNGDCSSRGVVDGNNINDNNNNNGDCSSSSEEDNLSDLADELVEVFELDKKGKTMEGNDNDGNDGMGLIVKECESENENGGNKGETLVVNDNKQDKVIDNNNNNITTSNKQQQLHQPLLIQEQPSHNIIEITSTPHFTSSISIVSQLSTTIPANPPKQQQQPVQPEFPPDDDTIIKTILETAKITESSPTLPQQTQSHTDNPSPDKKKVTFDPTRTFIIEYNENELITHLSVFNADYQPMKYKPKVVKNYKQITKNGVKPCINPEYTKYLKLNVKTMPKLVGGNNVVNANKKGNTCNSSRNLSSKKIGGVIKNETFTNIKRNISLNNTSTNTNTNGKINKTNNAMNTSMTITKQQMKGQSKGNAVHMDKTTNNNVGNSNSNSNSNSSKKVNKPVINKNEHNKDVNNNNNNKHKEQNIMTPIYEEDIDNDDNDDIYQSTRHYSL